MRKILGLLLIGLAVAGLLPLVEPTFAYLTAQVDLPPAQQATYRVSATTATNQIVYCDVPSAIQLNPSIPLTGTFFRCWTNHNANITLNWYLENGNSVITTVSGSALLRPGDASTCRTATLTPVGTNNISRPVTFRAESAQTSDVYVKLYFDATVTLHNKFKGTELGGGCP